MFVNKPGVTMIELLVYISLLGALATIVFSFTLQMQRKTKRVLVHHTDLHVVQMALDLLSRDIRNSSKIVLSKKNQQVVCENSLGPVSWSFNQAQTLLRLDQQVKLKKPVFAKVVERLKSFKVQQVKLATGAVLVQLKLVDQHNNQFHKQVLLRVSMPI